MRLMTDLGTDLVALAEKLARSAGSLALAGRKKGLTEVDTKSTATDMVTEFDRASERLIVDGLIESRPHDAIVGEEGTSRDGTSGISWFVDPIDGTTNFFYDLPNWCVSIGAKDAGGTVCGVVYVPALDEMFTAARGGGAWLNGKQIHCGSIAELSQALICTGFNYDSSNRVAQAERILRYIDKVRDVRRFGAAAIDICYVACGRLDGYYEEYLWPWDYVAADLIAREAGCRTGDLTGAPIDNRDVLISNPTLFPQLVTLIRESGGK